MLVSVQAVVAHRIRPTARRCPAALLLVLSKACLLTGRLAGTRWRPTNWSPLTPRCRANVVSSVTAVVASVGLAVAGAFLERACRIPHPGKDDDATPPTIPGTSDTPD